MADIVVKAEGLGKKYIIGHQAESGRYVAMRDVLAQSARTLWRKTRDMAQGRPLVEGDTREEIWALKDVSFEIRRGETVGIVGRNGAGKSTLLKVLSRITEPSAGKVTIRGRVASLLEVGTGFHPELTGRENIFLNGAILGMARVEIRRKFDEIVAFAEVEKFLDTPVKRYSSGMYVRLAFAVAAHLEPEILLVDEVLAVGDAEFQKKCLGKMSEVAHEGRTVLFVSHNMFSLQNLCARGMLFDAGKIALVGDISTVIAGYLDSGKAQSGSVSWPDESSGPGGGRVRLRAVRVVSGDQVSGEVDIDKDFRVEVDFVNLEPDSRRLVSLSISNSLGVVVLTSANLPSVCVTPDPWCSRRHPRGVFRTSCTIPGLLLNDGVHSVSVYVNETNAADNLLTARDVLAFTVRDTGVMRKEYMGPWIGAVRPRLHWQTAQIGDGAEVDRSTAF